MTIETRCYARQYSDQMYCAVCRLTWDTNDADPPPCKRTIKAAVPELSPAFQSGLPFADKVRL